MNPSDLPKSPFCELVGIEVLEASPGRSVAALDLTQRHCNALGVCHGAAIFALADRAFGVAENCLDQPYVAMEMHVRFLRVARAGQRLTATAERLHQGRQTTFYRIAVQDESNRLIASLTGTGHALPKAR